MNQIKLLTVLLLTFGTSALHAEFEAAPSELSHQSLANPAPRRAYWCAALLKTEPIRNEDRFTALNSLKTPRAALDKILAPTRPKTLLRRFIAWLSSLEDFHLADVTLPIADVTTHAPDKAEAKLIRKVANRLKEIEDDSLLLPNHGFPVRSVIRGREEVRAYLLALKAEAQQLELDHASEVAPQIGRPPRTPAEAVAAREGLFWKDLGRGLAFGGVGLASAYAALRGWDTGNAWMMAAAVGAGVGIAGRGLQNSFRTLRVSYTTYIDDIDLADLERGRRDHEARAVRADEQMRHIDAMLASLDADPATRARSFVYHGYTIELPMRNVPSPDKPRRLTADAIIASERRAETYDPVLNRWVIVDQIFQFDDEGEPTLITYVREQLNFAKSQMYDAWINNNGFMP